MADAGIPLGNQTVLLKGVNDDPQVMRQLMHRLLAMLESAWNTTEPVQPMAHVSDGAKAEMHHDHEEMLAAFLARDVERLVTAAKAHHGRLRASLAELPRHTGLFVDSE